MSICNICGERIEFRHIDGKDVPLHFSGGCGWESGFTVRIATAEDSQCYPTTCPECGNSVFFIRHNGGSVWIDPPLGPPWGKHGCMHGEAGSLINSSNFPYHSEAILGVARYVEIAWDRSCSVIDVITGDGNHLFLLVKNDPKNLVAGEDVAGELLIVDAAHSKMRLLSTRAISWVVVASLNPVEKNPFAQIAATCPMHGCKMRFQTERLSTHLMRVHNFSFGFNSQDTSGPRAPA